MNISSNRLLSVVTYVTPFITSTAASGNCTLNGRSIPCDQLGKQVGGFIGFGLFFIVAFFVLGALSTIFWIWMLVHAASHNIENKAMWIILIVFTNIIGAAIYYFMVKRHFNPQAISTQQSQQPTTNLPPASSPPSP